jgi:DNA-binding IclR family transcriptional regulator
VRTEGFCVASWQPEVVALACPIATADVACSLNVSVSTSDSIEAVVQALAPPLLALRLAVLEALARR